MPRAPQPFPLGPEDCPGVLGEVAAYIDEASATATEAGALAVALPVLGAVMGRAFATPSNLRTNILSVALGGSGSGKTSLVNPAKELLRLAGVPEVIGQDRIASGSGLLRMLTVEPRRVCFLDEFGHLLQQIGAPGAGIHSRQILTELTKLYSDAGTLYTGTAYAGREPEPIDCPHLCLFGMATPEQFWRAFGSSSLEDGSIARFLVFPIGAARIKDPDLRFQHQAVAAVKAVVEAVRGLVRGNLGRPALLTVDFDERADAARLALQETMQACAQYAELNGVRGAPAILRRVAENAQRIALISAVGRNPGAPVIEMRDFDIGHALARWSATTMIHNIASHIADNQTERDVNDVERFIQRGRRPRPDLARGPAELPAREGARSPGDLRGPGARGIDPRRELPHPHGRLPDQDRVPGLDRLESRHRRAHNEPEPAPESGGPAQAEGVTPCATNMPISGISGARPRSGPRRPSARRLRQLRRRSPPAGWLRSCAGWSRRYGPRRPRSPPSKVAPRRRPQAVIADGSRERAVSVRPIGPGQRSTLCVRASRRGPWAGSSGHRSGAGPAGEPQPGRQVEQAHQQVHRGHAVDRSGTPSPGAQSAMAGDFPVAIAMSAKVGAAASLSQGGRWNRLISRYIAVMPSIGRSPAPGAQSAIAGEFPVAIAMSAKVGAAASASQSTAPSAAGRVAPTGRQDRAGLTGSCPRSGLASPPLRRPTPRPISRPAPPPRRSCRASSTTCRAGSADSPRASPPTPPGGRAG